MKSTVLLICLSANVGLLATAESRSDEKDKADEVEKTALVRIKFKKVKPVFPLGRNEFIDLYVLAGRN